MRRAYLFGGLVCCSLAAVWSCGLDDTAVVAIIDQDGSTLDATSSDSAPGNDSSTDAGPKDSGTDTSVIDAGPCPAADLPTCDNGTCANAGEACTPPVAAGWTVVNMISGSRPACTAGYAARDVVELADGGAAACVCSCASGDPPSCANANVVLGSGNATCNATVQGNAMTAGCEAISLTTVTNANYASSVQASTACSGLLDASIPQVDAGLSRECALQNDAGATSICADHRACVPKPATGSICIAHASPATCPNGFSQRNVADSFADTRSCPACTCGWNDTGCENPTVTFHTLAACGASGTDVVLPSACTPNITGAFLSLGVTGTAPVAAPSCLVTDGGVVDGGVAITNDEVVCCAN